MVLSLYTRFPLSYTISCRGRWLLLCYHIARYSEAATLNLSQLDCTNYQYTRSMSFSFSCGNG